MKLKNRIISLVLCLAMITSFACLAVSAVTLFPVGYWVYEKINNNTEFEVYDYTGETETVFVPYSHNKLPIASIGEYAFTGDDYLRKITITKNVHTVSQYAFLNCTSLDTVIFQTDSVTSIEDGAFASCRALGSINLEDTRIEAVGVDTFMNCDSLTEITLPETVVTIENGAFSYCDNLCRIVIPESVTSISSSAFDYSEYVVIYCYEDSYAHRYAVNNGINFVLIKEEPTVPETQPTEPTVPETQPTEPTEEPTTPVPVRTYVLGDVNCDDNVSIIDATRIQLILVERVSDYTDEDVIRGDVSKDGVLSIMDVTSIQRYLASYDDGLNIGQSFEF